MYTIGIDIGSVASKAVVFDGEKVIAKVILPTGWSPKETGEKILECLLKEGKIEREQVKTITGTGYGRIALPFVDKKVTEITCHGVGAHFLDPEVRTVIDIGGQDSKVIKLEEKGKVIDFLMNDKCAAGTGRFLQVMAHALEIDISELSEVAEGATPKNINSMCTVFAESEVVSLMAEGASKESIAAGLLQSVANKTYSLVSKVGVENKVFFSGGVSKNSLLKEYLGEKLGVEIYTSDMAQFMGAIGAAVIGYK
ncbi:activator of (R)-2-hydroxyglutaryl-CoA dehydratase HgdC [Clostridium aceticum]|uniref:Activator of (R)-2-hydroxyglutaryl-CoA dehydratase HgdC n=1 Tax=Clostridium aceticum TaxID=84022 RepID=A0A0D8I7A4_9CLOT|nr:acyl-CoA dehydratase activase [Clostridium aceticum]AKL94282.1 activator of (R)-2-hydroxyglutaryl-CoA dehydratase HgdC [Clostridium aceticum]KJF26128.1 2-hydroxyglutaryl-CoA dehydratase [Clostridium aceticum]